MLSKNILRLLINIMSLQMSVTWSRLVLWITIILLITITLLYYQSAPYTVDPYSVEMSKMESLSAMRDALVLSSMIYTMILIIIGVMAWTMPLKRCLVKTFLSLPIGRSVFFIGNVFNIFLPPFIVFLVAHVFAGLYILSYVSVFDLLLLFPLILLNTLFIVSIVTLISLIVKDSIVSLFLASSIFLLPYQFPMQLKYINSCYFYTVTVAYIWHCVKHVSYSEAINLIAVTSLVTSIALILSFIYFLKMDVD
ncbi:MAG: hypothetical protein DRN04_12920 [Thermoprotei archaeon]|nr:MAG: hypothetical protein DRN04_12920 [Thermoprotei archaeon]